ncbi:hypothetical protein GCM10027053_37580 [Intrasporangium mesophilum]
MRRRVAFGVVFLVLLLAGLAVATGLSSTLGIRTEAKQVPVESPRVATAAAAVAPPALTRVTAPTDERTAAAVAELRDAVGDAGQTQGTTTLTVHVTDATAGNDSDTYRLEGTPSALVVRATTPAGAVRGIYDLALAVREGRPLTERLGQEVSSRLPFRMADLGAVGVTPDPGAWSRGDDYSHNSKAFADAILPTAPFVDESALKSVRSDADAYFRHLLAEGYTAVAVPGLLEYLTFSDVGDGHTVYAAGDDHVGRALAMRESFGAIWRHAHDLGLKVYFRTDMLTLSTPLQAYLEKQFGSLATERDDFWQVYAAGLDELYRTMPYVDGVVIRIGEAGRVYDLPGWDYYSELGVTTVPAVRSMLRTFVAQAERADREVVFRTWSVGVGAVGAMHTDPASFHAVLDGIDSDHLVVSTKYSLGDFYSHLPFNHTLETGTQRRIIELQSRREFEGSGALPNDLGDLYQQAIQRFVAANPRVEGIWTWTQDGGPWRAGPMTLELKAGFWQLYELNTVLAVRLARDPGTDPAQVTAGWARRWFSGEPAIVAAVTTAMADSRQAITEGLYVGPFAAKRVFALGLEPPPMMWVFEWDILTGDSGVLDLVYAVSRDRLNDAIAGGERAVAAAERMRDAVTHAPSQGWRDPALRDHLVRTLDYEVDLLTTLSAYRTMVLRHAEWLDTGSAQARAEWTAARGRFEAAASTHERRWAGDVDLPAYNLTAARLGTERADRDPAMAWLARVLLVLVVGWLAFGALGRGRFSLPAARALWVAGTRPWRASEVTRGLGRASRVLLVAVPLVALAASRLVQTWFLAPAHIAVVALGWLALAVVLALALRRRDPWPVIAAVGGSVLLRVALLCAVLSPRGPGGYWFGFWTDPAGRTAYVVVSFALLAWVLVAAAWSLRPDLGRAGAAWTALAVVGTALLSVGGLVGAVGTERALTVWNDQLALLPWGLSRILGITVYLGIPTDLPWYAVGLGAIVLLVAGPLAWRASRLRQPARVG